VTRSRSGLVVQPDGRLIGPKSVLPAPPTAPLGFSPSFWAAYQRSLRGLAQQAHNDGLWLYGMRAVKRMEAAKKKLPKRKRKTLETLPGEAPFDAKAIVALIAHDAWVDANCLTAAAVLLDAKRTRTRQESREIREIQATRAARVRREFPPPYTGPRGVVVNLDEGTVLTASGRPVAGVEIGEDGFSLVASAAPARVDTDRRRLALRLLDIAADLAAP